MSALSPRRAAEIEADPPCITFGEVRRLIAASKINDDLVAALKECGQLLGKMMPLLLGQDDRWVEKVGTALLHTHDALAKAEGRS